LVGWGNDFRLGHNFVSFGGMRPEEKAQVAAHQRRRFNELVDVFVPAAG
jgi:hypothetical protein